MPVMAEFGKQTSTAPGTGKGTGKGGESMNAKPIDEEDDDELDQELEDVSNTNKGAAAGDEEAEEKGLMDFIEERDILNPALAKAKAEMEELEKRRRKVEA